jgi:hypothetical protein
MKLIGVALLLCCGCCFAETNAWYSCPTLELRLLASAAEQSEPHQPLESTDGLKLRIPRPATNSYPSFAHDEGLDNLELSSFQSGTARRIYERLDRQGYFDRPAVPSDSPVDRFVSSVFEPEVLHIGKTTVSCSLVTAIKRKNPLCLLNPIFLDVWW